MGVDAAELVEIFQWMNLHQAAVVKLDRNFNKLAADEIGDVMLYVIKLADILAINVEAAINAKIDMNRERYPIK